MLSPQHSLYAGKLFSVLMILVRVSTACIAQSFENLSIDRPDVSNLPTTIRPGHYQFEIGAERGHGDLLSELHAPNFVFRTGLNRSSELRMGFDLILLDSLHSGQTGSVTLGTIGGKYRFLEEKGARPAVAVQAEVAIPFASDFNLNHAYDPLAAWSFLLLLNNTLHEQVFVTYNAGVFWSRVDQIDLLFSVSLSFLHTHRLGYFLEVYSLVDADAAPVSFDGGVVFLISPRVQADLYGGLRAFEFETLWFYGAGIGFRLDRGDLKPKSFKEMAIHY